jgi:hypothetical protein
LGWYGEKQNARSPNPPTPPAFIFNPAVDKPMAKLTADDARKMKVAELRTELANRDIACKGELKAGLVIAVLRGVARPRASCFCSGG